jgi:hypothetical protein
LSLKSLSSSIFYVLLFFVCFVQCYLSAVVCIHADSVIGHWLLSSARK